MPSVSGNVGAVFNGGTISTGLISAPAAPATEAALLTPAVGAAAAHTDALDVQDELGVSWFELDARHYVVIDISGAPSGVGGVQLFNGGQLMLNASPVNSALGLGSPGGRIGFYNTVPVALQTGVAVSAAGIHAALVNLGLITA